jgi:dTDP-4-amino-4,6-dideoxygalactose transaminase
MQFIDLVSQRARIEDRLNAAVLKVIAEGKYILGPEVAELRSNLLIT